MHKNYRRKKNRYRSGWPRQRTHLADHKKAYWSECRAVERECIEKERYDDLPTRHPRTLLYDLS